MSTLAIFLKKSGCFVRGSDEKVDRANELLKREGIKVDKGLNKREINKADVVVCSSAIKKDNSLYLFAKKKHKKILTRGQILGQISAGYKTVIAVAGSHGKTTTTALVYEILKLAGKNPTLHLGGYRIEDDQNFEIGDKDFFVTEACEYCDNFLNLYPQISVITNVEKEHLDYFKTFENQKRSFEKFKSQSKIVIDSFENVRVGRIRHDEKGGLKFKLFENEKEVIKVHMQICENVNTQNCIYAYLVAKKLGVSDGIIKLAFENFRGVRNRFEKKRCKHFENVVCDYAHHPTEIEKAIESAKTIFKTKRIITIFQPHTFSRTQALLPEFVKVFKKVETPLFFKTYSAREKEKDGMSARDLAAILKKQNKNVEYFDNFLQLKSYLLSSLKREDVLLFIGAGDLPNILHKNRFVT